MEDQKYSKGGYMPGTEAKIPMLVREDGKVSFDGPGGPWSRIITREEVLRYAKGALESIGETKRA